MKQIKLLILIAGLFLFKPVTAQTNTIKIHGQIDSAVIRFFNCKELFIKCYDPFKELINEEEMITVPINADRSFNVVLKFKNPLIYLSLLTKNTGNNSLKKGEIFPVQFPDRINNNLEELYLFEKGDSVRMFIGKKSFNFSGTGSQKLKCQFNLYRIPNFREGINIRKSELSNAKRYKEEISLEDTAMDLAIKLRQNILEGYKGQFSEAIYNRIYLDAIASVEYDKVFHYFDTGNKDRTGVLKHHYQKYLTRTYLKNIDTSYLFDSAYYPEMLFYKEYNSFKLLDTAYGPSKSFEGLFEIFKNKYTGVLRDRLLYVLVKKSNPEKGKQFFNEIMANLNDSTAKTVLTTWEERNSTAFPFELQDAEGKIHRLSDYKGKLIVMDFWFTYCTACKQLNKAMHPIIEGYKGNPKIAFITISTDRDKQQWLKSLKGGGYTSPGTINLYTNGMGFDHPLTKYYNFYAAPNQLIIGKDGKLISASPPRPDADSGKGAPAFIKLIEDHLKE